MSQQFLESLNKYTTRALGSVAQGLSTAASSGYETYIKTNNAIAGWAVAASAFFADSFSTYNFLGEALDKQQNPAGIPDLSDAPLAAALLADEGSAYAGRSGFPKTIKSSATSAAGSFSRHTDVEDLTHHRIVNGVHDLEETLLAETPLRSEPQQPPIAEYKAPLTETAESAVALFIPQSAEAPGPELGSDLPQSSSTSSILKQLLYLALDTGKNFSNRFFLFNNLWILFNLQPNTIAFKATLMTVFLTKQLFSMSNETFENVATLADTRQPFYEGALKKLLPNTRAQQIFRVVGALDHAIIDDLLPWLLLMPEGSLEYLADDETVRLSVILTSAIVGLPLALLAFAQAYLFEGRHTIHNTAHEEDPSIDDLSALPTKAVKAIRKTTCLIGFFHGAGTTANVYVALEKLLPSSYRWAAGVSGAMSGFFYGRLVNRSEVGEVNELLDTELGQRQPPQPIMVFQNNARPHVSMFRGSHQRGSSIQDSAYETELSTSTAMPFASDR